MRVYADKKFEENQRTIISLLESIQGIQARQATTPNQEISSRSEAGFLGTPPPILSFTDPVRKSHNNQAQKTINIFPHSISESSQSTN